MKKKNYRRCEIKIKFLSSLLSLILCIVMLIGTTIAWFYDPVTSANHIITADNMDMEISHVNEKGKTAEVIQDDTKLWNKDADGEEILWEPGVVSYETFTIENEGTVALSYKLLLNELMDEDYNTVKSSGKSRKDVLYVHIASDGAIRTYADTKMDEKDKTIAELLDNDTELLNGNLKAGRKSSASTVYLYWPADDHSNSKLQDSKNTSDGEKLWINMTITATGE